MIKKFFPLLVIVLLAVTFKTYGQLEGIWIEEVDENPISLIFESNGIATIIVGDEFFGGENFEIEAGNATMYYYVKESTPYNELDIVIKIIATNEIILDYPGIYELDDEGRMHLNMDFENQVRPTSFDENAFWLTNYDE